ncbi:MAG: transglycosylase SLT domain-containing protein [bacterium]
MKNINTLQTEKKILAFGLAICIWQLLFPQYAYAQVLDIYQKPSSTPREVVISNNESIIFSGDHSRDNIVEAVVSNTIPVLEPIETKEVIREYVLNEAKLANLDPHEVDLIVNCESRWNAKSISGVNYNGTRDFGLWQINSIHRGISDADKLDYKTATKWVIKKRLHDGNWSAWYCARRFGIK